MTNSRLESIVFRISVSPGHNRKSVKVGEKTLESFRFMFSPENLLRDSTCTFAQYQMLTADQKSAKKSAPGNWIPAVFRKGRRKRENLLCRTMVVFDLDYVSKDQLDYIRFGVPPVSKYVWFMHTTRSHCPENPRVRMILPISREVTPDEANALTRYVATLLAGDPEEGIEIPDIVSMRLNQVMYLPSVSRDQEYWIDQNPTGVILDVDEFLAGYPGWEDYTSLPYQEHEKARGVVDPNRKMEHPHEKPGLIGAFCRTYRIEEAIEEFLSDIYVPGTSETEVRYSYAAGHGSNGAVVYDDGLFLHSHHGTDPAEGLHNAFDLVRLHKFGHLDDKAPANTSPGNLPSFKAMSEFARADAAVMSDLVSSAVPDDEWDDDDAEDNDDDDLDDLLGPAPGGKSRDSDDDDDGPDDDNPGGGAKDKWQSALVLDKKNELESSLHNCATIIKNNKRIAPCIALNDLDGGPYLRKTLNFPKANLAQAPVKDRLEGRRWTDNDTAALMCALAAPKKMGGFGTQFTRQDVELSLLQAAEQNRYNPFLDKVLAVEWDGVPRLATFYHDWFYAEDNAYHAELATTWFIAGIARQYEPGHIYDLVPILGGKQGGGKTGAIRELGMGHSGSLAGDYGDTQKMAESTKGKVVLEVAELKGLSKSEIEDVKHYFSADKDTVRLAYRRNEEDFYRRCIYKGTTNQSHYLRDDENRRFCPVLTGTSRDNIVDFKRFCPLVPQFWAEAHHLYLEMRKAHPEGMLPLHFTSKEAKAEALRLQTEARETMPHEPVQEVIARWLDQPVSAEMVKSAALGRPIDSEFDDDDDAESVYYVRNLVTVTNIREELATNPIIRELRGAHAEKTIAQALKSMPGWEYLGAVTRLGRKARWYCRDLAHDQDEFVVSARRDEPSVDDLLG